jgi:hypothetical protein
VPARRRLKSININDRPSDLLASGAFVNDVDALSFSQSPLHQGKENSVLVTGRTEKHTKTSAARHHRPEGFLLVSFSMASSRMKR